MATQSDSSGHDPEENFLYQHVEDCRARMEAWGGEILQNRKELFEACQLISAEKPQAFVEIGSYAGGTLLAMGSLLPPNSLIVGIDISPLTPIEKVVAHLRKLGHRVALLCMDSVEAAPLVSGMVGDGLDCVLFDGDHGRGSCYRDWKAFYRLVKPGGLALVHDLANDRCRAVREDWNRIHKEHEFAETRMIAHKSPFLCQIRFDVRPLGFGVVRKRQEDQVEPYPQMQTPIHTETSAGRATEK